MKKKALKAVLVGCGGICNAWLNPIKKFTDVEITGLVDLKKSNAERIKEQNELHSAEISASLGDLLKKQQPDIVFDCTIPEAHVHVTLEALKHGCHVLGEKPMADTMSNARKMVKAAEKANKLYAVIQNRRYLDNIITFRQLVHSGKLGDLHTLNADFYLGPHFGGFREEMDHVLLLDMAIHTFDQARFITDASPVSVYCHDWNPKGSWFKHGASAQAIFEMSDGLVFNYRGSWCAEGMNTSWECDWRAQGSGGSALWDGADSIQAEAKSKVESQGSFMSKIRKLSTPVKKKIKNPGHSGVIREFLDCVKNGKTPQTVCQDNIKSLAMVHAAIESAEAGRKINIKL